MLKKFEANNLKELDRVAKIIAEKLKGGDTVALKGKLGSGKTALAGLICKKLNCKKQILSPSFVFLKIYKVRGAKAGIKIVRHLDAWRLDDPKKIQSIIDDEDLDDNLAVTLIEWPEKTKLKKFKAIIELRKEAKSEKRDITLRF